jgi:hypothetical protein
MASSHKKVILRRSRGDILPGYLPLSGFVRNRSLDLLDLSGRVIPILLNDIKLISFVRDFNLTDTVNPERLTRRTFLARPRTEGLWLRMTFITGEILEGLAPTDVSLLDDLINDAGLFLTPPDIRSNTQRIYVPRTSLADLVLIAVITSPSKKKPLPGPPDLQEDLFNLDLPPDTRPN